MLNIFSEIVCFEATVKQSKLHRSTIIMHKAVFLPIQFFWGALGLNEK